ncbi:hypothetical protein AL1_07550 [Alistipes shahii WAL 8301]|uniref:Uncharacterized protein n=1 Tax=Alistipes shahii WAL 8301 TaxID=717959 RepID=D4IK65_9BACT|nr:hypothetical protein AL1_07550 [Alistipes shahii WAL 8301]
MIGFYGFESEYRGSGGVFSTIRVLWQWLASVWHRLASVRVQIAYWKTFLWRAKKKI